MVLITLTFGLACLGTHQIKQVSTITADSDAESVRKLLTSEHRYIRLATVDQIQTNTPSIRTKEALIEPMLNLLYNEKEWCPIRGRVSRVLGEWQVQKATEGIIQAMAACDDESRYWMLLGLEPLSTVDPLALGAIQSLTYDTDIFIRTEAAQWLESK